MDFYRTCIAFLSQCTAYANVYSRRLTGPAGAASYCWLLFRPAGHLLLPWLSWPLTAGWAQLATYSWLSRLAIFCWLDPAGHQLMRTNGGSPLPTLGGEIMVLQNFQDKHNLSGTHCTYFLRQPRGEALQPVGLCDATKCRGKTHPSFF